MKGLILYTLYDSFEYYFFGKERFFKSLLCICIFLLLMNSPATTTLLCFIYACEYLLGLGARLQAEQLTGWNLYEQTLPVRKSQIILAKYASHLLLLLRGVAYSLVIIIVLTIFNRGISFTDATSSILLAAALSLLTGSIIYPLYLSEKHTDSSQLLISSIGLSVVFLFLLWIPHKAMNASIQITDPTFAYMSVIVSCVFFIISCIGAMSYYKSKDD